MGMRIDDTIRAVDYLASRPDVDAKRITAEASGHLGLVLLHAAVLDARLAHVTVDDALSSYRSLIEAPMPRDAPQDILPGVVRHYDLPELDRALGSRLTITHPLSGTDDLAAWNRL
jgi:cephalosporin-C deacetylase-like acetyl esterase